MDYTDARSLISEEGKMRGLKKKKEISKATLWCQCSPEKFPWPRPKQALMQSQDLHKTKRKKKKLNLIETSDTMRETWHPLWGGMGPSRQEAKHMHWHCYRHPQASRWLPASKANELSHLSLLLHSPPQLSPFPQSGGPQPSTVQANISSAYPHPPAPF